MERKLGDIFLSKVTGKKLIVTELESRTSKRSSRCLLCEYGSRYVSNEKYKDEFSFCQVLKELRTKEAGHCSAASRKDNKNVYFSSIEDVYKIPEETRELLNDVMHGDVYSKEDIVKVQEYLLELENIYKK